MAVTKMLQQNLLCIDFVEQILPPLKVLCNKMLEAAQPLSHCFEMCAKCMGGSATGGSGGMCVCESFIMGKTKPNKTCLNIYVWVPACKSSLLHEGACYGIGMGQNDLCILYFQCATLLKELSCVLSAVAMYKTEPIHISILARTRVFRCPNT